MFAQFQQNYRIPGTDYKIIRFISKGTGGYVYVAEDTSQNTYFALKIQQLLQQQEYNALSHLFNNGPFQHVVNIQSLTTPNQFFQYYLIGMDLADGSFSQFWEQNAQKFDLKQILEFFLQITEGLEEIHKIGLIHRDMKLENVVFCNQNGQMILKICDTGLMRDNKQDLRKTNMIGTPYYMPPEQINKNIYDEKVDIWSLGVILFEMITQTKMLDDPDTNGLLSRIIYLTQNQIDLIILSQKQKIPIKIQELLKQMIRIDSTSRLQAQDVIFRVKSILFQDSRIQQVKQKPINMQQYEQEKRRIEKQLQQEKEIVLQNKSKQLDKESQMQKQQLINDLQKKQEAEKEQLLQEQRKQIELNKRKEIKKLEKERELIEQNIPDQKQFEISIKNTNDEYQRKFEQIEVSYSEQLKQLETQIQNDQSQQFEIKKEEIQQQIVQNIQNQVSQQFQQKFEQENLQMHQIMKFKENYIEEFTKSQVLAQMEMNSFTNQQFQEQISQNQEKKQFVKKFVEELQKFLQQIQLILNQLQKIQTKDEMEQFEKMKNEFVNIQHQNIKYFIQFQKNSFQEIDNRQQIIIQKQRLQSIAQECNELTINIDNQTQDFIKQLQQYKLSVKYKQTLSNYQNQNILFKYQIQQLNESQFQFTSEQQMNLLKQNVQNLQNNLNIFIKTIIKEIEDQLKEGILFLEQKINYFHQIIKQTTDQDNFRNLYNLYIKIINQQQSQDNLIVKQLIENLMLISEFCNLNNNAIEYIQIFAKFQQFSQNKLNVNLDYIIDDFTVKILNQVIKYMQNFTKKLSNKELKSQFNEFLNTQFKKFFEKLISEILQQFDNQKIKELILFHKNYQDDDFKDFISYIQNVEEEIAKALQIIQEDINKGDQEVKIFQQVSSKDQIYIQILEQFQIAKQNQQDKYNQLQNYVDSTQQSTSLKQVYESSCQNLLSDIKFLFSLKNQILTLQEELKNIKQTLQPQYLEKVSQWFNDLNQLQEIDVLDAEKQQLDKIFRMQCVCTFNYELFLLKSNLERFRQYYQKLNQQQITRSNNNQKVQQLNSSITNIEKIQQIIIKNQFILQQNEINQYQRELLLEKCNLSQAGVLNSFQQQKEDLDDDKISLQILIQTTQKIKNILGEKIKQMNLVKLRGKISSAQLQQLQLGSDLLMRFGLYQTLIMDSEF